MDKETKKIVLIEDDEDIAELIHLHAEELGYEIRAEYNGLKGYRAIQEEKPDVIVLDIMLPGLNGLDICRQVRENPEITDIPLIILSAKNEELDVVLGLEMGADDYVEKPFSPKVLFSRIKAVLRRKNLSKTTARKITFDAFAIDLDSYLVKKAQETIPLTFSEFSILKRLLTNRGKVLTRNQLLDDVHRASSLVIDRNVDVHVAALRKKLGPEFDWIETIRGVGYRFKE